ELMSAQGFGTSLFAQGNSPGADDHFGAYGCGVHMLYGKSGDGSQMLSANLFVDPSGALSVEWLAIKASDGSVVTRILQKVFTTSGGTLTGALTVPGIINTGDYFLRNLVNRHIRFEYLKNDGTWAVDGYIYKDGVDAPNRRPGVRINCGTPDKDKGNTTNSGDWVFGEDGMLTCPGEIVPGNYTNFDARYDAKYPTNFRVGARVTYNGSDFGSHVPQGAVNINNYTNNDDRINGVVYAYLQYNLNGNWVNFA
ncbi:MAG: hypothetical protein QM585_04300, partial [Enterobacter sp.]